MELTTGSEQLKCLGTGTINLGFIQLKNSAHVDKLNGTLVSVGQICDDDKGIIFAKKEAIILNLNKNSVNNGDVVMIVPRNDITEMYKIKLFDQTSEKSIAGKMSTNITGKLQPCHPCLLGEAKKNQFNSHFEKVFTAGKLCIQNYWESSPGA